MQCKCRHDPEAAKLKDLRKSAAVIEVKVGNEDSVDGLGKVGAQEGKVRKATLIGVAL